VVHRGPWNATAALIGASAYAVSAAAGAATGVSQAVAFTVAVGMRLAALRWGLQTPVSADVSHKLIRRRGRDGDDNSHAPADDKPGGNGPS
jgi:uncharacterized membrane protein YeiH